MLGEDYYIVLFMILLYLDQAVIKKIYILGNGLPDFSAVWTVPL